MATTTTTSQEVIIPPCEQQENHVAAAAKSNSHDHDDYRIALYYYYYYYDDDKYHHQDVETILRNNNKKEIVKKQVSFHQDLCVALGLKGRVRISCEGLNGVLSGLHSHLLDYEKRVSHELLLLDEKKHHELQEENKLLDVKYCHLRKDLPIESQLFPDLMVKETKTVISLFDHDEDAGENNKKSNKNNNRRSKQAHRRQRRKEKHQQQHDNNDNRTLDLSRIQKEMMQRKPSQHLTAQEWNEQLLSISRKQQQQQQQKNNDDDDDDDTPTIQKSHDENNNSNENLDALLLDVRNVYESRVGQFVVPHIPTLLTNTRKYSDLPHLLASNEKLQSTNQIYMYCTGGVRCERVSQLVQTLYPTKTIYQLQGGIQSYMEQTIKTTQSSTSSTDDNTAVLEQEEATAAATTEHKNKNSCLFWGKNFVFDPRRTDANHNPNVIIGQCLICQTPHDDYDNGHAPCENKEARCNTCRMLILICNTCRPHYQCWGEEEKEEDEKKQPTNNNSDNNNDNDDKKPSKPLVYCGFDKCVHEGAVPEPELVIHHATEK